MERPLTDWERKGLSRLASLDGLKAPVVLDSLPHVVVTGECGRGCPSFNGLDTRCPEQPHQRGQHSNGWTPDKAFGFACGWARTTGRSPWDVFDNRPEGSPPEWPDPAALMEVAIGL